MRNPITGIGCWARAMNGHVIVAPPTIAMRSRRLMLPPLKIRLVQWLKPSTLRRASEEQMAPSEPQTRSAFMSQLGQKAGI